MEWRFWGLIVYLDREEGCLLAQNRPEAEAVLAAAIPQPWGTLVVAAITIHKEIIKAKLGTEGTKIHVSWAGVAHWFGQIGAPHIYRGRKNDA